MRLVEGYINENGTFEPREGKCPSIGEEEEKTFVTVACPWRGRICEKGKQLCVSALRGRDAWRYKGRPWPARQAIGKKGLPVERRRIPSGGKKKPSREEGGNRVRNWEERGTSSRPPPEGRDLFNFSTRRAIQGVRGDGGGGVGDAKPYLISAKEREELTATRKEALTEEGKGFLFQKRRGGVRENQNNSQFPYRGEGKESLKRLIFYF